MATSEDQPPSLEWALTLHGPHCVSTFDNTLEIGPKPDYPMVATIEGFHCSIIDLHKVILLLSSSIYSACVCHIVTLCTIKLRTCVYRLFNSSTLEGGFPHRLDVQEQSTIK